MRNEVIKIICKQVSGSTVTENSYEVFAEKKSVSRSEFYAAYQVGLNPRYMFDIDTDDWLWISAQNDNDPTEIEYNGKRYTIIRSYERHASTEVTCG